MIRIEVLDAEAIERGAGDLGTILLDCVEGGASVSFMEGLSSHEAEAVYRETADDVLAGHRLVLGGYIGEALRGTVQVILATPQNQPHRAELSRLLVHRSARWRGLGRALVLRAEREAAARGKTLMCLDTTSGSLAERLYAGLGYQRVGVIPGYALHPNGIPSDAVFFWKNLPAQEALSAM
ncbi:GNAT family N-acetyltransferase [Lichenihabitans psoromatis]|uniref:GNAT family N-acetyltransferase n=1 Tax=Lichenihabitans psoromatis TaxID=2528642 RepID=UPI001FE15F92|nr:GNAT family N-acetyltransferase [Lichenihabitans psoromatis]